MSELNTILNDLKSEAEFDSHGHFTLDKSKAREKMKKYQLRDPHYYVLEIVQAAVASGATYIDVYLDADDCVIAFDGEPFTREDLENLYSSLFVSQKNVSLERFRELAIGVNSAQALKPRFVKVISGNGTEGIQLTIDPSAKPPNDEILGEPEEIINGTKIHVKDRISWRVAGKFFTKSLGKLPTEGTVIEKDCKYCKIPIEINDKIVNPTEKIKIDDVICSVDFDRGTVSGMIGIPFKPYELSHLKFVKLGVHIKNRNLRLSFIPINGIIHADILTKNASQSDIVENEIYKDVLEKVSEGLDDLIIVLINQYNGYNSSTEYQKKMKAREYLLEVIESRFKANLYLKAEEGSLMKKLGEVNLFETTEKNFVSLKTLVKQYEQIGFLPFSRKYFNGEHPDGWQVVYIGDEKQVNFFDKIFVFKIKNVEQDFYRIINRETNKKEWLDKRKNDVALYSNPFIKKRIENDGITAEIGLVNRIPEDYSRVDFCIENGSLIEKAVDFNGLSMDVVVNNNKLNPAYTWDDVKLDDETALTLHTILKFTPGLYLDLAHRFEEMDRNSTEDFETARLHLIKYLGFVLGGPVGEEAPKPEEEGKEENKTESDGIMKVKILDYVPQGKGVNRWKNVKVLEVKDVDPVLTDVFKNLKLFYALDGSLISLGELEKELESYFKVPYLNTNMPGPQLYEGHIVVAESGEEKILKKFFGWYKVENYEKGLKDERIAMTHLKGPEEKPVILESVVDKAVFKLNEIQGEMGLLKYEDSPGHSRTNLKKSHSSPGTLKLRILKKNRFVTIRYLDLSINGLYAVISSDNIRCNTNWSDVIEDEKWEEFVNSVKGTIELLARRIHKNLSKYTSSTDIWKAGRFLREFMAFKLGRYDYAKPELREDAFIKELMQTPLFIDLRNNPVSLLEIKKDKDEYGNVAYVSKSMPDAPSDGRVILKLTIEELEIVKVIFGNDHVENVEKMLEAKKMEEVIKKTKPVEKPLVNEQAVLCSVSFDQDGITGEIGLVRKLYAPRETFSAVKVLKENRFIATKLLSFGVQLEGAVNYDQVSTNSRWNAVVDDENFDKIKDVITGSIDRLMEELLSKYDSLDPNDVIDAERHIISYITLKYDKYPDLLSADDSSLQGKMAHMKLFRALGGSEHTYVEVSKEYNKDKKLYYVPVATDQVPLEGRKVFVFSTGILNPLKKHFTHFIDYTSDLMQEQIAINNMKKPKLKSLTVEKDYLVKTSIDRGGIKGELALPSHLPLRGMITFAKDMVPVVDKLLYSRSNVFGILNGNGFDVNQTFSDVNLFAKDKRYILEAIYDLYDKLADRYSDLEGSDAGEVARRLILDFYYEQKNYFTSEYKIMETHLEEKLSSLPLIPIFDGRYVNVNVITEEIERQGFVTYVLKDETFEDLTENVVLKFDLYSFDHEFCRRMFGIERLKHLKDLENERQYRAAAEKRRIEREMKLQKAKEEISHRKDEKKEQIREEIDRLKSKKPVISGGEEKPLPKMTPVAQKKAPPVFEPLPIHDMEKEELPPEKRLLFAVKREFRIIRERGDYKLSERVLRNMRISDLDDKRAVIYAKTDELLIINSRDPVVKAIMETIEGSPHVIYYLLSIIYSTINRELLEITDEDEMKFQMVMLENLLEHPSLLS